MDCRGRSLLNRFLPDPCDNQTLFFTNLQLLGLDPAAMEAKWRIEFKKDMFNVPNKRGFEVIMHFLFSVLNPTRCDQEFRHCFPVRDKKEEQQFRRVCNNWLTEIAKEDEDARLPRIVASTFMSPVGDGFYHLLFAFSSYVIYRTIVTQHGLKQRHFLRRPLITPQTKSISNVMGKSCQCAVARDRRLVLDHVKQTLTVHEEWKKSSVELVHQYRALIRQVREFESELKTEVQHSAERGAARGSPIVRRRHSGLHGYDFDVQSVKRAQRVQKVRELWKHVEEFHKNQEKSREIVESILQRTLDKYKLDGNALNVKVPDLLLRECEQEIQRRRVDNIYQGGKLNMLSLLHLWNLSLHLYIEKFHQVGVVNFEDAEPVVTAEIHTHQAHLTNIRSLRSQLTDDMLPRLKSSIEKLKRELDAQLFLGQSPNTIRSTSIGLGLLPPTPPINLNAAEASTGKSPWMAESLRTAPVQVTTPEGASQLLDTISHKVHTTHVGSLPQGSPIYAPRSAAHGQLPVFNSMAPTSRISGNDAKKQRSRMLSAPASHNISTGVKMTASGTTMTELPIYQSEAAKHQLTEQVSHDRQQDQLADSKVFKAPMSTAKKKKQRAHSMVPKVEKHSYKPASVESTPPAIRKRAEQIVEMMLSSSPSSQISEVQGLVDGQSLVEEAFTSQDKLARTPVGQKSKAWHDSDLHDSYGPLSSTRIDQAHPTVKREKTGHLQTPLFSLDDSDEEEKITTVGELKRTSKAKNSEAAYALPNSNSPVHKSLPRTPLKTEHLDVPRLNLPDSGLSPDMEDQLPDLPLTTAELEQTMRELQLVETPKLQPRRTGSAINNKMSTEFPNRTLQGSFQSPPGSSRMSSDQSKPGHLNFNTSAHLPGRKGSLDTESDRDVDSSEISSITSGTSTSSRLGTASLPSGTIQLPHASLPIPSHKSRNSFHKAGDVSFEAVFGVDDELLTSITMPPSLCLDDKNLGAELFVPLSTQPAMEKEVLAGTDHIETKSTSSNGFALLRTSGVGEESDALTEEELDSALNLSSHIIHVQNGNYKEFSEMSPKKYLRQLNHLKGDNDNNNSFQGGQHRQPDKLNSIQNSGKESTQIDPNMNSFARETEDIIARYNRLKLGSRIVQGEREQSARSPPTSSSLLHAKYLMESPKQSSKSHKITLNLDELEEPKSAFAERIRPMSAFELPSTPQGSMQGRHLAVPEQQVILLSPTSPRGFQTGVGSVPGTPTSMATTPVSPLTKALHSDMEETRMRLDDLLAGEDDSLLLPSSLPRDLLGSELGTSPPVGNLINI